MKLVLHIGKTAKATKSHYWFTLKARNGKILMTSETYKTRRSALSSMRAVLDKMHSVIACNEKGEMFFP